VYEPAIAIYCICEEVVYLISLKLTIYQKFLCLTLRHSRCFKV